MGDPRPLSREQIETYLTTGILVVPLLTSSELDAANLGLRRTLLHYGVDATTPTTLARTGHNLADLSSTNGSGGVLDVFYPRWKFDVALNPRLFAMTCQLWDEAYCHAGERREDLAVAEDDDDATSKWHPFGPFETRRGFAFVDRIGFRVPTELGDALGRRRAEEALNHENDGGGTEGGKASYGGDGGGSGTRWQGKKKCRPRPLQRSLTPHLDCCPETYNRSTKASAAAKNTAKFRPIQCMVSLTENMEANTGGFEAVSGFHREFDAWSSARPPSVIEKKMNGGRKERVELPPPCLGEYTHIRPAEDAAVFARICHIPVRAGDAVFWDNRIPHANSYRHLGKEPRAVVYCSFLPDVDVNRRYVAKQLEDFVVRRKPGDQWIEVSEKECEGEGGSGGRRSAIEDAEDSQDYGFDEIGRKLMGMSKWG